MAKRVVRDAGVPTADFAVIESEADIAQGGAALSAVPQAGGGRLGQGRGRALARWTIATQLDSVARDLLARFRQPVLVEEFLPGREFTVGITGTGADAAVLGVSEIVPNDKFIGHGYGFENKEDWEDKLDSACRPTTPTREAAGEVALAAWRVLRCRDGGRADIRLDSNGQPRFIEVNPLAGIRPGYSDLCFIAEFEGLSYQDLIGKFLDSFLARHPELRMKILVLHSDIARRRAARGAGHADRRRGGGRGADRARPSTPSKAAFRQETLAALLARARPDIVFNLVEGVDGQGRLAPLAPRHAGAIWACALPAPRREAMAITNDKPLTKRCCAMPGLPRPTGAVPPALAGLDDGRWIVKAALEDALARAWTMAAW